MGNKKKNLPLPQSLGLPATGADSHAHLDLEPLSLDVNAVILRAKAAGVARIGQVFLGPVAYHAGRGTLSKHPELFFLLGMHPHDASACDADCLDAMEAAFNSDPRLKALGETGLDFFYDHSPREAQREVFRNQLQLARDLDLPVVVHSRDAFGETLDILDAMGFAQRPLLWHCFGGGPDEAQEILRRGWDISIPGPVTFPKSETLRQAVAHIPLDRLHLETDCPYLAPAPYRGKTNEPALAAFTAAAVAEVKGLEAAQVWTACGDNTRALFGLDT